MSALRLLARREALLIAALIAVALVLLAIVRLGSEIAEDGTSGFDNWLIVALRQPGNLGVPIGPAWLQTAMIDITTLGGVTALTLLVMASSGFLVTARRYRHAALLVAATISGTIMGQTLKLAFARARPQLVPHLVDIATLSYPSGHALNSAIVYLTLGAMLARTEPGRRTRLYIMAVAIALTLLIGCSRVYIGVHWPTDVLAGWAVGGSWALLWWAIAVRMSRPRRVAGVSG